MTKNACIWDMASIVLGIDAGDDGESSFTAENVDILEIIHPRELFMQIDDGSTMTIDIQKGTMNAETKDQLLLLLSSISPDRVHAIIDGSENELQDDE